MRSNLIVASGTALSRLTGLIRVIVFAYVIGQNALSDAYKLGNETPNIVYDLIIGGVLSATLVPVLTSLFTDDDDEGVNAVVTIAMIATAALTALAVLCAPWIFRAYALSTATDVDPVAFRSVGTALTRIFLIQIFFYGVTGVMNALLNSRRRFAAAAWSPIVSNLVIIGSLLSLPSAGSSTWALGDVLTNTRLAATLKYGATGGIAAMAIIVAIAVRRSGITLRWQFNLQHVAVRRVASMSVWTLGFVIANQIALIIVRNLANPGSSLASAYFDAFMFFVLPHGLLAVSIATTLQPELATAATSHDGPMTARLIERGTRATVALTAPASALLITLGPLVVAGLMGRGQFGGDAVTNTSDALRGLAVGLVGFSVYMLSLRGFYAHHDTRTPFALNVIENLLNIVFAIILVRAFGIFGLGLALALAYLISAVAALFALQRHRVQLLDLKGIGNQTARMLLAAVAAGGLVSLGIDRFGLGDSTGSTALIVVVVAGVALLAAYAALARLLRVAVQDLFRLSA